MIIRSKAPLRISFSGGGTDVPPYSYEKGGIVLNATINKYAYASVKPEHNKTIKVNSVDYDLVAEYNVNEELYYDGKLDLVKAVFNQMKIEDGAEIYLHSDAPPGSGLGSSSTMVVAMVEAIRRWKRVYLDNYDIAELAYKIERKDLGIAGGYQDQYAAAFGGFNFIEFNKEYVVVNPLKIKEDVINELQYNLILCYTGGIRLSANIINDQVANYKNNNIDTIAAMDELKDITNAMKSQLLRGNLNNFGELLHFAWENKKKMSTKISNSNIDEMYAEALKYGALGGKLLGAGGGGYIMLYCPYHKKHHVQKRMKEIGGQVIDWAFESRGAQSWITNNGRGKDEKFYQRTDRREHTA